MYVLYLVIVLSVAAPPTKPSAEMVSPTTVLVSWEPPSDGPTVTGYILTQSYTDQHERIITLPSYITRFTQITTNCEERLNITLQAVSQHLSSIPVPIEFVLRKLDSIYCIELHMCMQTSSYCCNYRIADILLVCVLCMCNIITGYGSTLYIGIAMVFVFSPYIWKFTSCFQFQANLTFNDLTAQNMSKVICVPNISLNYHFLAKL